MLKLPEALTIGRQLNETLAGRTVQAAVAAASPHGFAWYGGEPQSYKGRLQGRSLQKVDAVGGLVRLFFGDEMLVLNDGVRVRHLAPDAPRPEKHQLLVEFDDGSAMVCSVQMYGGMILASATGYDNPYYLVAVEKPSPLSTAFDAAWFDRLFAGQKPTLSAKALLATEQRIPGLGNGVLQDILFNAGVHPKTKLKDINDTKREKLFHSVKNTLADMAAKGGRNTERDLFDNPGGYQVLLSSKTVGQPCPVCGALLQKQAYMGGSVYFCPVCQPL